MLREIDFLLKICDRFLACFTCGVKLLDLQFLKDSARMLSYQLKRL